MMLTLKISSNFLSPMMRVTSLTMYLCDLLIKRIDLNIPSERLFSTGTNIIASNENILMPKIEKETYVSRPPYLYNINDDAPNIISNPFLKTMRDRGFLHQCTNIVELNKELTKSSTDEGGILSAYLGFDVTADSLHIGSLQQIMILRHFQNSGYRPIILIGGGTSKVGDPTGKDESRKILSDEIIFKNTCSICKIFEKFLRFDSNNNKEGEKKSPNNAILVNNDAWLSDLNYLDFLREYGMKFTINRMLSFDSIKQRLDREAPLSFLEFNYMIFQAYDFLELSRRYGVRLQFGGSDQWGNIVAGIDLGRRCDSVQLFGLTSPLITSSSGRKIGKSSSDALWLNVDKSSEYDYWQFWRNVADDDVIRYLKLFTEVPLQQIEQLSSLKGSKINEAKVLLADEATSMLHGKECLISIHETASILFHKNNDILKIESLPRIFLNEIDLENKGIKIIDLFLRLKLTSSKKSAHRLIQQGGAKVNNIKIEDVDKHLCLNDFREYGKVILRSGRKKAGIVLLKKEKQTSFSQVAKKIS